MLVAVAKCLQEVDFFTALLLEKKISSGCHNIDQKEGACVKLLHEEQITTFKERHVEGTWKV